MRVIKFARDTFVGSDGAEHLIIFKIMATFDDNGNVVDGQVLQMKIIGRPFVEARFSPTYLRWGEFLEKYPPERWEDKNPEYYVRVKTLYREKDFPYEGRSIAIVEADDGYFGYVWGGKYPFKRHLFKEDVITFQEGVKWFKHFDQAAFEMRCGVERIAEGGRITEREFGSHMIERAKQIMEKMKELEYEYLTKRYPLYYS